MRITGATATLACLAVHIVQAQAPTPVPTLSGRAVVVKGMPPKTDNLSAVAILDDRVLMADDEQRSMLVGHRQPDGSLTIESVAPLNGPGKDEFDLEALAVSGNRFYAIGSHALTRRSADDRKRRTQAKNLERMREAVGEREERQVLFRLDVGRDGSIAGQPSSGVQAIIKAEAQRGAEEEGVLARALGVPSKENGVDIEGLAADGQSLWVGFRGPVLRHGYVPVLRVSVRGFPAIEREELLFVQLDGRGIRDLVRLSDGFLVLAGAVGDSDQSTQLVYWDGRSCVAGAGAKPCVTKVLGEIAPVKEPGADQSPDGRTQSGATDRSPARGQETDAVDETPVGRAEGVAVIEETKNSLRILVVFDGVQGGAPTEFVVNRSVAAGPGGNR